MCRDLPEHKILLTTILLSHLQSGFSLLGDCVMGAVSHLPTSPPGTLECPALHHNPFTYMPIQDPGVSRCPLSFLGVATLEL